MPKKYLTDKTQTQNLLFFCIIKTNILVFHGVFFSRNSLTSSLWKVVSLIV